MKCEQIKKVIAKMQLPSFHYKQIVDLVYAKNIDKYQLMTCLPKELRDSLTETLGESYCLVRQIESKSSRQANKVLFQLADENQIEAVNLKFKNGWQSFCLSSQCGCGFGCKFCATGLDGFKRQLSADEITDQLLYFRLQGCKIDSVSFMGMGEPLANPNIFKALKMLVSQDYFGLSQRRITISTVGIIPSLERLKEEFPQINIAFSLHSPFEKQRSELMPINEKYPLSDVLRVLDKIIEKNGRKVFLAYTMLYGINDSIENAKALVDLIKSRGKKSFLYHLDIIPYNMASGTEQRFSKTPKEKVNEFCRVLKKAKMSYTVRTQFGDEIDAACGQLRNQYVGQKDPVSSAKKP